MNRERPVKEAEKKPPESRRKTERAHALEALERGRLHKGAGPGGMISVPNAACKGSNCKA